MIYHADRDEVIDQLKHEGVTIDPNKKIIMYAPTWKGSDFGKPELGLNAYFEFLDKVKVVLIQRNIRFFCGNRINRCIDLLRMIQV